METPLSDLVLPVVNPDGEPCECRVKDADALRTLYVKVRDADLESDRQRAKVQALADGQAPYNQAKLNSNGQGYMSNFNPNDMKAALDASLGAYIDLLSADVKVFEVFTKYGTDTERAEWSEIMSEELGHVLRGWPLFTFRYAFIPHYFTLHGVGIAYFEDCQNWQWNTTHLGYFKIPRQTLASEDEIEYAFCKTYMQPHALLRYIKNEEAATAEGWNISAVKNSLLNTVQPQADTRFWMEFEAEFKNNDLVKGETAPSIPLVYGWVREADSTYSLYLFTESPLGTDGGVYNNSFLYQRRGAFKSASEAFVFFTRGIGTNGTYHSIRGLGADMYNAYQALMRLENRKVDIAFSAGPILQAESEEAMQQLQITPMGPYMLATPGVAAMQGIQTPQVVNTVQPAVNSLRETVARNSGGYAPTNPLNVTKEMTRFEAMAKLEQDAQLSVTSINLYNQPADRLAREVVRRMSRQDYMRTDPGGHYVWEWRERCMERGVPAAAFDQIDHRKTRTCRVVGFGSAAARRVAFQNVMELFPYYDDFGKQTVLRRLTASVVGYEAANEIIPRQPANARTPIDYQIAELQNDALMQGGAVTVSPSENKRVHLEVHIGKIGEFVGQFQEAGQNPEMFAQIVPPMEAIYRHAAETLDGYTGADAPQFRQQLQQAGEILVNGIRHLQKLQRQQAEQMQAQAEQGQPTQGGEALAQQMQISNELERRTIEFQMKLEQDATLFQQRMQQKTQEAALNRQLKAAETAADIARKTAQQRAQLGIA